MPSTRTVAAGCSAIGLVATAGIATAQSPGAGAQLDLVAHVGARFVGAFLGLLLLAGLAVLLGERYVQITVRTIHDEPGESFVWGLLVGIGVPIVLVLIGLTIIGLLITIPGLFVVAAISLVGQAVAVVWIGSLLVGERDDPGGRAVLAGALALAVLATVPLLGNPLLTIVGYFGTGVVGRRFYESWGTT